MGKLQWTFTETPERLAVWEAEAYDEEKKRTAAEKVASPTVTLPTLAQQRRMAATAAQQNQLQAAWAQAQGNIAEAFQQQQAQGIQQFGFDLAAQQRQAALQGLHHPFDQQSAQQQQAFQQAQAGGALGLGGALGGLGVGLGLQAFRGLQSSPPPIRPPATDQQRTEQRLIDSKLGQGLRTAEGDSLDPELAAAMAEGEVIPQPITVLPTPPRPEAEQRLIDRVASKLRGISGSFRKQRQ